CTLTSPATTDVHKQRAANHALPAPSLPSVAPSLGSPTPSPRLLRCCIFRRNPLESAPMTDWTEYVRALGQNARQAARQLVTLSGERRSQALRDMARLIRERSREIIDANAKDIAAAEQAGLAAPLIARLRLDEKRVEKMAVGVDEIAAQTD